MGMSRAMRNQLLRNRRRKNISLDGSVAGAPYSSYRRSRKYASGYVPSQGFSGPWDDLYNRPLPHSYHPNMNAPAAQSPEYENNPDWESHQLPQSSNERFMRPFPDLPAPELDLDYTGMQEASDFFLKLMEVQYQPFEDGEEVPSPADIWLEHFSDQAVLQHDSDGIKAVNKAETSPEDLMQRVLDMTGALGHLETVFPEDHQDIINLRGALHEIFDDPEAMSKLESFAGDVGPSKLGLGDPYSNDVFEEIPQLFDHQVPDAFAEHMFGPAEAQINPFEQPGEFEQQFEQASFEGPELEQIVEQEGPFGPSSIEHSMIEEIAADMPGIAAGPDNQALIEDEINQAIDQVAGPMEELDPFACDPFAAPDVFGPQYMPDPYMMPGAYGPMPGPGAMPGPDAMPGP